MARFELFPGEGFQAQGLRVEDALDGSSTWIGTIDTPEEGSVVLTLGDKGVFGRVDIGLSQYVLQTGADGYTRVTQIDPAGFGSSLYDGDDELAPAQSALTAPTAPALATSSNTVDVLVLYTAASMISSNTTDPGTLINNLVADANNSYVASQVSGAMRVVGYVQSSYVEYADKSTTEWGNVVTELQQGTGAFSNVLGSNGLRAKYGADLVALLVDNTKMTAVCGVAPVRTTNDPSNFAAVIAATCAIGDRTFTHELGHKMSARHNWQQSTEPSGYYDPTDNSPYHYNHGYWSSSPAFKDIMAVYPNCATDPNGGCARINRWSSPNQTYLGTPLGVPLTGAQPTDMVTTLNNTMPMVAGYVTPFGMVAPGAPTSVHVRSLNCRGQNEVDMTGASGTVGWFEVYTASSTSFSPQTLSYRGPDAAATINVSGTTYVRARSCNAAGCSAYVNGDQPAMFTNGCF